MNDLISLQCEKYCLGGLMKNPEIFPEIESWVKEDTFGQSTHRVIWSVLKQSLLKNESVTPTLVAQKIINLNIKTKDDLSIFDYLNSISFSQITDKGTIDNFKELVKLAVLRDLVKSSDKVKAFISENKNKELKDIVSGVDAINNEKVANLYKNIDSDVRNIFDDIEPLIEGLGNNPPDPDSFILGPFSTVNEIYGSLNKPSNITIIGARSGSGKAQPIWCNVFTLRGWKPLGDVKIGDKIIGADGKEKSVLGVFPQGKKKIFKVKFSDGSSTFCCDDHLWAVNNRSDRKRQSHKTRVKPLSEIRKYITIGQKKKRYNYFIPLCEPIVFDEKKLLLHPYLLGFLLGDGCLTEQGICFGKREKDVVENIRRSLPESDDLSLHGEAKLGWYIKRKKFKYHYPSDTKLGIRALGLEGKNCFNKFIPKDYLFASVDQRIQLLQGLVDTDGTIIKHATVYSSVSSQLIDDIMFLVGTLGGKATKHAYFPKGKNQSKIYVLHIAFPKHSVVNMMSSIKHKQKFSIAKCLWGKSIVSVEEQLNQEECVCISVEDTLYITDGFNVTHNTSLSMFHQVMVAEKYNLPLLWLDFGEMTYEELQFRATCMLTNGKVPLWALETGQWRNNAEWVDLVRKIWQRVKKIKFYYQDVSNMGPLETISFIRRFSYNKIGRGNNFLVMYDYFKPFDTQDFHKPEWKQMGHFLQNIKSFIVNELPIPFMGAIQLNRSGITTNKTSDQVDDSENAIGMSDRITQQSSHAFILRFKTMDEIAVEENRFGNMKLINVKQRHLGKDYMAAIKPVKIGKRYLKNHINLEGGSFYYEDKGDLNHAAKVLKEQYDLLDSGEVIETL